MKKALRAVKLIKFGQPSHWLTNLWCANQPIVMLENLSKIKLQNPVDLIISQVRQLISSGELGPGDKLPPERKLAEHLGVSRSQVREAISKLQIYGIVKVQPQSGTVVNGIGIVALKGLISDVLRLEQADFVSLVDTRILLEKEAACLAAVNRTKNDLVKMSMALNKYEEKLKSDGTAIEEDLLFHISIADASNNSVLKSLMMIITPDIVKKFRTLQVCDSAKNDSTMQEHREIYEAIVEQDPDRASLAMTRHLQDVRSFSREIG